MYEILANHLSISDFAVPGFPVRYRWMCGLYFSTSEDGPTSERTIANLGVLFPWICGAHESVKSLMNSSGDDSAISLKLFNSSLDSVISTSSSSLSMLIISISTPSSSTPFWLMVR